MACKILTMLRKIRITLAAVCFTLITLLFLDFTGTLHAWLGWLAKIQFLPAVLALNLAVVIVLIVLTLLFGRVYCSVICPMGVFQDIVSWISGRRKGKKARFTYSPAKSWLRYGVLALFVIALIAGIGSFAALLDPYSAYGRIVQNLFSPLYRWGNNSRHPHSHSDTRMAQREDILQHDMPCRHRTRVLFPFFPVQTGHRC